MKAKRRIKQLTRCVEVLATEHLRAVSKIGFAAGEIERVWNEFDNLSVWARKVNAFMKEHKNVPDR